MITETFYKGFATEMCNVGRENKPLSDEEYSYMMGLIKGAYLCNNINIHDYEDITIKFAEIEEELHNYQKYVFIVKDLMTKQREDQNHEQKSIYNPVPV